MRQVEYVLKSKEQGGNSGYQGKVLLSVPKSKDLKKYALQIRVLLEKSKVSENDIDKKAEIDGSYLELTQDEMLKYIKSVEIFKGEKKLSDLEDLEYEMDLDLFFLEIASFLIGDRALGESKGAK